MMDNVSTDRNNDYIPSGFAELDGMTGGWRSGDLIVIAARPGMGKTSFALSMAQKMITKYNYNIAYFSLGMDAKDLEKRMIYSGMEKNQALFIDDTPTISASEFCDKCGWLVEQHNVRIAIIDYLQLICSGGKEKISNILPSLKAFAKEMNIPVIVFTQLNYSAKFRGEFYRPQLANLPKPKLYAIEQHADMVSFIHRPDYFGYTEDENDNSLEDVAEIIIAKNRNGATGIVRLFFDKILYKFIEDKTLLTRIKLKKIYQRMLKDYENFIVEELEMLITGCLEKWEKIRWDGTGEEKAANNNKLNALLTARQKKLNDAFEWTPENIEKLLALDKKIIEILDKLRDEAKKQVAEFEKQPDFNRGFLFIHAEMRPCILTPDENGELCESNDDIEEILMDRPGGAWHYIYFCEPHSCFYNSFSNDYSIFKDNLKGQDISGAIPSLIASVWSFPDVLRINNIVAELHVDYFNRKNRNTTEEIIKITS